MQIALCRTCAALRCTALRSPAGSAEVSWLGNLACASAARRLQDLLLPAVPLRGEAPHTQPNTLPGLLVVAAGDLQLPCVGQRRERPLPPAGTAAPRREEDGVMQEQPACPTPLQYSDTLACFVTGNPRRPGGPSHIRHCTSTVIVAEKHCPILFFVDVHASFLCSSPTHSFPSSSAPQWMHVRQWNHAALPCPAGSQCKHGSNCSGRPTC